VRNDGARRLGLAGGAALVVSSMVGTGIYTTTGLLVRDLGSARLVLLAWGIGGLLSCCGALAYGRLATFLPFNGGEYQLLSRLYHPAVGFIAGWVSIVAGFSAPLAASAVAFACYSGRYLTHVPRDILAISLVWIVTALHLRSVAFSSKVQVGVTSLQVGLIAVFVAAGLALGHIGRLHATTSLGNQSWHSLNFAHALVYVTFAYSGWNAAVYVAGEIKDPARTLPRALVGATGFVTLLYILVNVVYLASAPLAVLSGVVDIGAVVAERLFGTRAALAVTLLVCLGLAGCVSALTFSGPRVLSAMGADSARSVWLTTKTATAPHARATLLQSALATILILTSSFEALMTYVGIMLSLSTLLALLGIFRLRKLGDHHAPSIPTMFATSLAAILVVWIIVATTISAPASALLTLATVALGWLGYRWFHLPVRLGDTLR
jgi:basic amino acid/polyamine antiporter, APA family